MKRFVQHCSVLTLMLCLLTAPLLFAQGRGDVNNADLLGIMVLKEIQKQKAKTKKRMAGPKANAKEDMKDIESKSKKSINSGADKAKSPPLPMKK